MFLLVLYSLNYKVFIFLFKFAAENGMKFRCCSKFRFLLKGEINILFMSGIFYYGNYRYKIRIF